MRLIYISEGNIPSRAANATQAVTMADALSRCVDDVTLLTAGTLPAREPAAAIFDRYGMKAGLRLMRIPVATSPLPFMDGGAPAAGRTGGGWRNRFVYAASLYAGVRRPDLVYARCCRSARYATLLGVPTIVEFHGSGRDAARQLKSAPGRANLLAIVTVSEYLRADFVAHGLPGEKILVEPNGVDLRRFDDLPARGAARAQLGLPTDRPIVIYCGGLQEKKGVSDLIAAARHLPAMHFCLVGGRPEDVDRLRTLAGDLDNIVLPGFVPSGRVPLYLTAGDVLVLPNTAHGVHALETCPLKLFEYAAAGRPIVATRIAGIESLVGHGEQAWLVAPDAPAALADGIRHVVGDSALGGRLAANATRWVAAHDIRDRARRILRRVGKQPDVAAGSAQAAAARRAA